MNPPSTHILLFSSQFKDSVSPLDMFSISVTDIKICNFLFYSRCNSQRQVPATDWKLCVFCQKKVRGEKSQCPANAKQQTQGSTYVTLAKNLVEFHELGRLPPGLFKRLDEGDGVEETFKKRKASFHLSCRSKYNSTNLKQVKRKTEAEDCGDSSSRKFRRRDSSAVEQCEEGVCFLCENGASKEDLRNAATFRIDTRIRECATILQDHKLSGIFSAGDVISQELKYHSTCLTTLYRRADQKRKSTMNDPSEKERVLRGLAFAELTEYIFEAKDTSFLTVFKLADLAKIYNRRLHDLGLTTEKVHSGRLKTRLLAHFPYLQEHASGRNVLLTFSDDLGSTLKEAYTESWDDEAVHLAKAARIVRRDLFLLKYGGFTGSFDEHSQYSSVPETLLALMQMILQGPSIETASKTRCQASLTLAQLASYNAVKSEGNRARQDVTSTKHHKERETPVAVHLGLLIHAQTRKKELVDDAHNLALSIPYNRVLEISSELSRNALNLRKTRWSVL